MGAKTAVSGRSWLDSGSRVAPRAPASLLPIPPGRRQHPSLCPPPHDTSSPPPGSARPPAAPESPHMALGAGSWGPRSSGRPGPNAARARWVLAPPLQAPDQAREAGGASRGPGWLRPWAVPGRRVRGRRPRGPRERFAVVTMKITFWNPLVWAHFCLAFLASAWGN